MSEIDESLLRELARQAAGTARSHLDAAKFLLTGKFWPQAYALAAVGFEEAGKGWIATLKVLSPTDLRDQLPADLGRDHVVKLEAAYSILAMLQFANGIPNSSVSAANVLAGVEGLALKAHAGSQRGLYTDVRDGAVRSPAGVTEQDARDMVAGVEKVLDGGGILTDLATALWARDALPEEIRAFLAEGAEAAKAGDEVMDAFIQRELSAMERVGGVMRRDPEVLQLIKDDPDWLANLLRLASELPAPDRAPDNGD